MKRLTGENIEQVAKEVRAWARKYGLGKDWSLFYNGKRMFYRMYDGKYSSWPSNSKNVNPLDYCKSYPHNFIMGMAYDENMYKCINGYDYAKALQALEKLLEKHGLILTVIDHYHCAFVNGDNDYVEYTILRNKKITSNNTGIKHVATDKAAGKKKTKPVKKEKKMVNGGYLEFEFKGDIYKMTTQSSNQGDTGWMDSLPKVKKMIAKMGANIKRVDYDYIA